MTGEDVPDRIEPLEGGAGRAGPPVGEDRLAVVWNGLHELTARLDGTEDAVAGALDALSTAVADLKTQLAGLLAKEREKDVTPRRWADRATAKDWTALVDWVDRLIRDYSLLGDYAVPPCWPAHPGVVEELAGLWRSWTRALINDQLGKKTGGNDLTAWHDRWLWPALRRLKTGHYRTTNCRDHHDNEHSTARPTDRALVDRLNAPAAAAPDGAAGCPSRF